MRQLANGTTDRFNNWLIVQLGQWNNLPIEQLANGTTGQWNNWQME